MKAGKVLVNGFEVEISHTYNIEELQQQWLLIQKDQSLPFFLTWAWISCWIETYHPELIIVSAKYNNKTVAIGLFTCSIDNRHGFIKSRQLRLHQMGHTLLDQIWMEYNDFICTEEHKVQAVNACIQALQSNNHKWHELILSMMIESRARDVCKHIENAHILAVNPSYAVNMDVIKQKNKSYLATLKANTRYQIRRSIRLYQQYHGEIKFIFAKNNEQALELFHEAGKYHLLRWDNSGYNNQNFVRFHENLIKNTFNKENIALMKVSAGDTTIAILYFHLVNKNVFFYLQGLNYETDNKLKPGLVAHSLATQYFLEQGMSSYEYMGGYSQYKCQLASPREDLVSVCIQRPKLKFLLEQTGSKIKCRAKKHKLWKN